MQLCSANRDQNTPGPIVPFGERGQTGQEELSTTKSQRNGVRLTTASAGARGRARMRRATCRRDRITGRRDTPHRSASRFLTSCSRQLRSNRAAAQRIQAGPPASRGRTTHRKRALPLRISPFPTSCSQPLANSRRSSIIPPAANRGTQDKAIPRSSQVANRRAHRQAVLRKRARACCPSCS